MSGEKIRKDNRLHFDWSVIGLQARNDLVNEYIGKHCNISFFLQHELAGENFNKRSTVTNHTTLFCRWTFFAEQSEVNVSGLCDVRDPFH